jgi:beta-carotene hydroxylase
MAKANPASTVPMELAAGRRNTPGFGWPTILLLVVLYAAGATAIWAAMTGRIPYVAACLVNTLVLYAIYTPVHEAVHGNISQRHRGLAWVDFVVGLLGCIPMWLFYWEHKRQHVVHHARCNHPDDPDLYAKGSFAGWLLVRLPISLIGYFNPVLLYRRCRQFDVPARQTRLTMAMFTLQAALWLGLIAAGYGVEVLVFWFIPWWIGNTVMLTLFTWTPHHDHRETGRYRDTRESLFPGATLLLLGQNHHLIHHMMPQVPWYRYDRVFNEIRPILERNGVRIEGFWPSQKAQA